MKHVAIALAVSGAIAIFGTSAAFGGGTYGACPKCGPNGCQCGPNCDCGPNCPCPVCYSA